MNKKFLKKTIKKLECVYLSFKAKLLIAGMRYIDKEAGKILPKMHKHKLFRKKKHKPDKRAEIWEKANPWICKNDELTNRVFQIHKRLINVEGYDPSSWAYYNEIDRRMYDEFYHVMPQYFSMNN